MNNKQKKLLGFLIGLALIIMGLIFRILPHPPNFSPVAAIALFGGFYFSRKISMVVPLFIMFLSDIFIGFYEPVLMAFVYGSFLICVILGFQLKKHKKWHTILQNSLLCSLVFFFLTNFAVWAFTPWYAKSFSGLIQCYLMAIPFLKNTLLGNLFFTGIIFGTYEVIKIWAAKKLKIVIPVSSSVSL